MKSSTVNVNEKDPVRASIKQALFFIIRIVSQDGLTALYIASINGHVEIVRVLLKYRANVLDKDDYVSYCI